MYEFGVMKALGTGASTVTWLVLLEAFWLGVCGVTAGSLIGIVVVDYFSTVGISFGEMEFTGIMLDRPFYPILSMPRFWLFTAGTLLFTVAAGIYPGVHAAKLNTAGAIRKSL